jgi:hypothetical protein
MKTIGRNPTTFAWQCVALAMALGTCACGGSVGANAADAGVHQDSGQPGDAGADAPWSPVCPQSPPAGDSPCTQDMLQCEYGNSWWNVSCDMVMQCVGGRWISDTPSSETCTPEPGPNASFCPQSPMDVGARTSCPQAGAQCVYGHGAFCFCTSNAPDGGEPLYWGCEPEPGCPSSRPPLGSACSTGGLTCTYDPCVYQQKCVNGVWQGGQFITC